MDITKETQNKVKRFARMQSQYYLEDAEMTYLEKMRKKQGQVKKRIIEQLAKFKSQSNTAIEAENDMISYMNDYIADLMADGLTEEEAFAKAKEELVFRGDTDKSHDLKVRFMEYYRNKDLADREAINLLYSGFIFLGLVGGALGGFLHGKGWVNIAIGSGIGLFIGLGLGFIVHAILVLKRK